MIVGKSSMESSNWGAYAREFADVEDVLGVFAAPKNLKDEILASEDPKNEDYALSITDLKTQTTYSVNPYFAAACHARFIDEAMAESDENCRFAIDKGRIVVVATKPIKPGEQLLIRYGHEYWLRRIKDNPLELSMAMYEKYKCTMKGPLKGKDLKDWERAISSLQRKGAMVDPQPKQVCANDSQAKKSSSVLLATNHEPKQVCRT
jgi:hypothetical protein